MIGYVLCECLIYDVQSLKEKRSVVKSIISRLKQRFNLSVAEIDYHDIWQRTAFGIAVVAISQTRAEQELQKAIKLIDADERIEITKTIYEWL
ncbi:DUF503 domain-containing protein [Pueribacillus theae]|uniref:DUF503 domain-containing protein n=1 Tax=Pueribacillus theae TaxID=2171751 RepID=A0A2U1K864_9BACI|nr:DUF503 domain-containing protein [Pueribacillus theae]PWA13545.1 DUF503 domain-containing protein [Pueribacillus theae]